MEKKYEEMTNLEKKAYLQGKIDEEIKTAKEETIKESEAVVEPEIIEKTDIIIVEPEVIVEPIQKKDNTWLKIIAACAATIAVVGGYSLIKNSIKNKKSDNPYNGQTISIESEIAEVKGVEALDLEEEDYKNLILAINDQDLDEDYTIARLTQTFNTVNKYNVIELTNNYAYDAGLYVGENIDIDSTSEAKDYLNEYYTKRNTLFDSIKNNEVDSKVEANAMSLYKFIFKTLAEKEKIDLNGNVFDINSLDGKTSKLFIYNMAANDLALINTVLKQPELSKKTIEGDTKVSFEAVEANILEGFTAEYEQLVICYDGYQLTK